MIPVSARKRTGLDVLLHAAAHHKDCNDPQCLVHHHKDQSKHRHNHHAEYAMVYSDKIEDKIDLIMDALKINYPKLKITVGMLLSYWKWIGRLRRVTLFICQM